MIKLVPLTKNDLEFLLEIRNDESTRFFLENNSVFTIEECKNWFFTFNPKWFLIKNDDQPVGYFRTNGDEIGCDIHPKFRRLGFARMAYLEYLKDKNFATLWVFEDNFAKNLYSELGFETTGETKLIRSRFYLKMIFNRRSI